jgi:hypothetical protein
MQQFIIYFGHEKENELQAYYNVQVRRMLPSNCLYLTLHSLSGLIERRSIPCKINQLRDNFGTFLIKHGVYGKKWICCLAACAQFPLPSPRKQYLLIFVSWER